MDKQNIPRVTLLILHVFKNPKVHFLHVGFLARRKWGSLRIIRREAVENGRH